MIGAITRGRTGRLSNLRASLAAAVCALGLLAPATAEAKWLRAETPHFVIYSDGDEQVLRDYARRLEDFDGVLRYYHNLSPDAPVDRKLDIYLMRHLGDMQQAFNLGSSVAGFYRAGPEDVFAVAHQSDDEESRDETLFHEYVHHFMNQYFPYPYPAWLKEGWAEYFQTTDINEDKIDVGNAGERAYSLASNWVPMKHLLGRGAWELRDAYKRSTFYAQAWLLTHYMLVDPQRKDQLTAYMKLVADGQDSVRAMEVATGADIKVLEKGLRSYMRKPLVYTRHGRSAVARSIAITTLPASADDLLLIAQRAKGGVGEDYRRGFVAKARSAAAKHPGDRFAELTLARVEVTYGDRTAGEAILTRLLAADPNDVDALRLMAGSKLRVGQADPARRAELFAEARPFLARAFKTDPNHYQTLFAYAVSRSTDPDYPSENTLNTLLLAHQIAPQVPAIALETAKALAARGRKEEAIVKFRLLANAPHGGEIADAAKIELDKLTGASEQAAAEDGDGTTATAAAPGG